MFINELQPYNVKLIFVTVVYRIDSVKLLSVWAQY